MIRPIRIAPTSIPVALPLPRLASLRTCCALLLLLALPPYLALALPRLTRGDAPAWYATHATGALRDETDFAVVMLKFHPVPGQR